MEVRLPFSIAGRWCNESSTYRISHGVFDWLCERNLRPRIEWDVEPSRQAIIVSFDFECKESALLFKLTWSGL